MRLKVGGIAGALFGGIVALIASLPIPKPEDAPDKFAGNPAEAVRTADIYFSHKYGDRARVADDMDFDCDGYKDEYVYFGKGKDFTPVYVTHSRDLITLKDHISYLDRIWYKHFELNNRERK